MKNKIIIIAAIIGLILLVISLRNCQNINTEITPVPVEKKVVKTKIDSLNEKQKTTQARKDSTNAAIDTMSITNKRKWARQIYLRRKKEREDHECEEHEG